MSALYTPDMLGLAASLARFPLNREFELSASARSKTCGSVLTIGFELSPSGAIQDVGLQVTACAIGQSSAAILAHGAKDAGPEAIRKTHMGLQRWLQGEDPLPDWPNLDVLAPALDRPGRHGALLLPWEAAVSALSSVDPAR